MGTDPRIVADQAGAVAAAWSAAGAPPSWALTAATFEAVRDDPELLALAATIPDDRLPPLLFTAATTCLILELAPSPLRDFLPRMGEPQPPLDHRFAGEYRAFCLDHRDRLLELCDRHRYQMNEVGRCAQVLPALAPAIADGRDIVLIDVGTGAGLALQLDRYRYVFSGPGDRRQAVGDPGSQVVIETVVRDGPPATLPSTVPRIVERVGIDVEPLDLADDAVRTWLAACIPQEIGAVTRFHRAVEIALAHPARRLRGDACTVLPQVLAAAPPDALVCLTDTYVHVFFTAGELRRFRALVAEYGARRDIDWISVDPLVPMGDRARDTVLGIAPSADLVARNRREGVFGLIGRRSFRAGDRADALLGIAHPGAAWLQWLPGDASAVRARPGA